LPASALKPKSKYTYFKAAAEAGFDNDIKWLLLIPLIAEPKDLL
jgi:hypothetical protein